MRWYVTDTIPDTRHTRIVPMFGMSGPHVMRSAEDEPMHQSAADRVTC
jgi:hypothetical protein